MFGRAHAPPATSLTRGVVYDLGNCLQSVDNARSIRTWDLFEERAESGTRARSDGRSSPPSARGEAHIRLSTIVGAFLARYKSRPLEAGQVPTRRGGVDAKKRRQGRRRERASLCDELQRLSLLVDSLPSAATPATLTVEDFREVSPLPGTEPVQEGLPTVTKDLTDMNFSQAIRLHSV